MESFKPSSVKEHNLGLLRQLLISGAGLSARQLSEKTGLSVVSINKLVAELIETGEISIQATPQTTGGRKATLYQYNPERRLLLIFQFVEEASGIVANLAVVNLFGETLQQKRLTSDELHPQKLLENIQQLLENFPKIQLIVFGITGAEIAGKLQIMDFAPLQDINLRQLVTETFAVDVLIENDINAAALSQSQPQTITVALYYPKNFPPGAAVVINGQIFHGTHGLSGEIKHLPFVQRAQFPISPSQLKSQILETLQTVISVYDPAKIILYLNQSAFSQADLTLIEAKLAEVFPYFALPPIHLAQSFQEDYFAGLLQLGLAKLRNLTD
ncbi:ROK family protein [Enterococcus sp. HY326]|uniref:ROK family protein n=1 Tax=Enterococcus sp. HY326 TaxID=2971265 RepID=UPI00223FA537|nr:ROK family protein [Enterococcus sp. HY326]